MTDSVYVLGNGLSRKNIDPYKLEGTVVGCNACYRNFKPDVLCAIDAGIIFEIIESGYDGDCYFTHDSWNPLPAEARNHLMLEEGSVTKETKHRSKEFVVISGFDEEIDNTVNYIMWVPEGAIIKNMNCTQSQGKVARNTGTTAVYVACRDLNPKKIYLLGFDHDNDKYDNLYANTPQYFKSDRRGWKSTHKGWTNELLKVIRDFPEIEFFWINSSTNFHNQKNLHFIDGDTKWPH